MNARSLPDEIDEKPLDPAFEKVRRKMIRLLIVSVGIMMAGLMAVLVAIVYRAGGAPASQPGIAGSPAGETFAGTLKLPPGAAIVSLSEAGGRVTALARLADGTQAIFLYDVAADRVVGRIAIGTE